jgi:hypothetical protein
MVSLPNHQGEVCPDNDGVRRSDDGSQRVSEYNRLSFGRGVKHE